MLLLPYISVLPLLSLVAANRVDFDQDVNSQVCAGIYSKHDWGGSSKPHIAFTLNQYGDEKYSGGGKKELEYKNKDAIAVSYVVFEYKDLSNIGVRDQDGKMNYICDDIAINEGLCDKKQKDKFIVNNNVTNSTVLTNVLTHLGPAQIDYPINKTGYYCVATFTFSDKKYHGRINFQNAFGELSASEIPKLPAYGILAVCYAIASALFGFQFFKKRKENQILPLQKYLLAMIGFLTFDTVVVWSYYDLVNRTKNPASKFVLAYMGFLSILNALKITFSLFLLLLIALGYGVVTLKLKKKVMLRCKILAGVHLLATVVYLVSTYYNGQSNSTLSSRDFGEDDFGGLLGMIPLIPVTLTLSAYYLAILISIKATTANLHQQRQVIKLQLYERLFRIIFVAVVMTLGGFTFSSFIFLGMNNTEIVEEHWKSAFFLFEFWPSVVFFFVFVGISWLWRPTETSYMLAVSQQLSGGENIGEDGEEQTGAGYHQGHEFELDDLSLLSHSDHEQARDNDSFELRDSSGPSTAPPVYEELENDNNKKNKKDLHVENDNTLFDVGEDESDHDRDDRLRD
ncbi:putative transmembrane protein [Suhomyces tanzawaensis NRRL Y-17324]|uniref:Putative transmembrane protein n=1 Tax=Suhomyces tanzawaensis NRRL Y-17324 TaxID=984487 RepID=A0A1E4SC90_9ASCO|nr:putative transmembrane protein [Suhomyces tanzawaensis NRRL Y-17324]ODV77131.1 putative transmembrane protein [Suhomyces tanzawaensis NRRL Y-17324]